MIAQQATPPRTRRQDMGIGLIQPMHLLPILVIVLAVFGAGTLS